MLFAIDHGNSAVKTTNFVFTSGLAEYPVKPPLQTDVLEWGGKFWALSGQRISFMRDKTRDDRFFILTLFAIAMELRKMGQLQPMLSVELAVGLPPEHYGTLRDKFANYFKRGSIQFVFNDTPICLMVQQVFVYPQAYAAVVPQAEKLRETPRTFVVDIGGYTTDVLLLRTTRPDMQFCRSLELGMIRCLDEISEQVRQIFGVSMTDAQIESVLRGGAIGADDRVRAVIHAQAGQYVRDLLSTIMESGLDVRAMPTIFLGGGAALLKRHVSATEGLCRPLLLDDVSLNAKGYERLTARMLGGEHGV